MPQIALKQIQSRSDTHNRHEIFTFDNEFLPSTRLERQAWVIENISPLIPVLEEAFGKTPQFEIDGVDTVHISAYLTPEMVPIVISYLQGYLRGQLKKGKK